MEVTASVLASQRFLRGMTQGHLDTLAEAASEVLFPPGHRIFGADEVVNPGSNDPVAAIKDLTHGRYADLTLDTSSNPEARLNAIRSTKVWGTMCFVGEGGNVNIDVSPHLLRRQLTLVASWTFSTIGQAECARYVVDRKIDVDKLFTHRWKLEQAEEAYKLFDKQSDGKGVFLM